MTTRGEAVVTARAALTRAGLDSPALDARLLVAHALSLDALKLITEAEVALTPTEATAIDTVISRRLAREPVSRIIGERWFHGRRFRLDAATLDPRPDSETLVETVLAFIRSAGAEAAPVRLLDVGTGTGCLLLSLLAELPSATGVGIDVSADALAIAATNATELGISSDRVAWKQSSGFASATGTFNVILSNPPYIPTSDIADLDAEVRCFDPIAALDGGRDGLDFYRSWSRDAVKFVDNTLGMIIFEVGLGQAVDVAHLLKSATLAGHWEIGVHKDLAQTDRCVSLSTRLQPLR